MAKGNPTGSVDPAILDARAQAALAERAGTTLQLGKVEDPPRWVGPDAWAVVWALARKACVCCAAGEPPEMWESLGAYSWWHGTEHRPCTAGFVWGVARDL